MIPCEIIGGWEQCNGRVAKCQTINTGVTPIELSYYENASLNQPKAGDLPDPCHAMFVISIPDVWRMLGEICVETQRYERFQTMSTPEYAIFRALRDHLVTRYN